MNVIAFTFERNISQFFCFLQLFYSKLKMDFPKKNNIKELKYEAIFRIF